MRLSLNKPGSADPTTVRMERYDGFVPVMPTSYRSGQQHVESRTTHYLRLWAMLVRLKCKGEFGLSRLDAKIGENFSQEADCFRGSQAPHIHYQPSPTRLRSPPIAAIALIQEIRNVPSGLFETNDCQVVRIHANPFAHLERSSLNANVAVSINDSG